MYFTAEAIPEPTVITLEPEATAVVRHAGVTVDQLPALFDAGYQAIQDSGTPLADPAFALLHRRSGRGLRSGARLPGHRAGPGAGHRNADCRSVRTSGWTGRGAQPPRLL